MKTDINCNLIGKRVSTVLAFLLLVSQTAFGLILPAGRAPNTNTAPWSGLVGVDGGIPTVTTIYTNLTSSATPVQINAAIAACPSNQVVQLGAGTYTINSPLNLSKNGVVLRGAGPNQTILILSGGQYLGSIYVEGWGGAAYNGVDASANWTSGYAQGSSNIVLSSTSGLSVGMIIGLDQLNDNVDVTTTSYEGCSQCGRSGRSQVQYTEIRAISGNTVTIWPPLLMPNFRSSQSPGAFWYTTPAVKRVGLENLSVNGTAVSTGSDYGENVSFHATWNCWIKNVNSTNLSGLTEASAHFVTWEGGRTEIRHCNVYGTRMVSMTSYGIVLGASSCLVEDNTSSDVYGWLSEYESCGNVIAYNYSTNQNDNSSSMAAAFWFHDAHACMNLLEGNWFNSIFFDDFHGSSGYNVVFRNRLTGYEPGRSDQLNCAQIEPSSHYNSYVGNVLGTVGVHSQRLSAYSTGPQNGNAVLYIGYSREVVSSDASCYSTFYDHGNYDVVTRTNSGVVWSTNSDHSIPSSLYLTSKPSYWGANQNWPPFNPANPAAASMTNIPAGYRFVFGVDPPSGGPDTNAPTISNISAGSLTTNSATITWTTSKPATSIVDDGATTAYGTSATNGSLVVLHGLTIAGLSPGSTNHFRVRSVDSSGNLTTSSDGTFTVATPLPTPTGLRVIGP
jgi:hypothetical protein